jgi:hypothetical protein
VTDANPALAFADAAHLLDHVASAWRDWRPGHYLGATDVVAERLSGP